MEVVCKKTLLEVTRHKNLTTEFIEFNTVTGVIIEPLVVIAPYFSTSGYLNNYTLYCTLQ
jgi:ABC-type cobalamin transport system permease subunit